MPGYLYLSGNLDSWSMEISGVFVFPVMYDPCDDGRILDMLAACIGPGGGALNPAECIVFIDDIVCTP